MFAKVIPHPTLENVQLVTKPSRLVTFDVVSNPSHSTAKIQEFLTESHSISDELYQAITEDEEIFLEEGLDLGLGTTCACDLSSSKYECSSYIRQLIEEQFTSLNNLRFII